MDIYSLIVIVAILAVVIVVVTRPLFKSAAEEGDVGIQVPFAGKGDYDEILNRIRELDFEYKLGKIPAADYDSLREELKNQAAGVLQAAAAQEVKQETKD